MKNNNLFTILGIIIIIVLILILISTTQNSKNNVIKIGVITDLSGGASYWGNSTRVGADLAASELKNLGYNVQLIYEDYQLDPKKALSAAQKLVNVDNVQAIYAEFNPAAISVGSFLKGKNILYVYDAAPTSPLNDSNYTYKTYLDYKEGCKQISEKFKNDGISKMGVLKVNQEYGELCLQGVKEVYGNNTYSESYNLGDQDFKTQILKLNNDGVGAIINVGFEGDTLNTLKVIKDMNFNIKYGTVDDTLTSKVISTYSNELKGSWSFGFGDVSKDFSNKISSYNLSTEYGAALAYTHISQMVIALFDCKNNMQCVQEIMNDSLTDPTIGFEKFNNRIAVFNMNIKQR